MRTVGPAQGKVTTVGDQPPYSVVGIPDDGERPAGKKPQFVAICTAEFLESVCTGIWLLTGEASLAPVRFL